MQWQWRASQGGWVEYGWNAANKISYIHNSDTTRQMTISYDGGGREVTRVSSRAGTTSEKKILLMGYEQSWTQAAGQAKGSILIIHIDGVRSVWWKLKAEEDEL